MSLKEPYKQWSARYDEYRNGDHWQVIRKLKFKEVGRKCLRCKTGNQIHVHHIRYRNLVDVNVWDLIVLCKDCHEALHTAIRCFGLQIECSNVYVHHISTVPNGLPPNVVIRSDGTHFAWDDTNPKRLWDSTLVDYGLHVKFNTYQEALDSAKAYVSEMNAKAEQGRKRAEEVKKGQDVGSWPVVK